jgi:hypothetical protein
MYATRIAGTDELRSDMSTGTTERLLVPYDEARHLLGDIGRTKFYELIDQKHIERVSIGRRGFVTAASLTAYVESLCGPPQRD